MKVLVCLDQALGSLLVSELKKSGNDVYVYYHNKDSIDNEIFENIKIRHFRQKVISNVSVKILDMNEIDTEFDVIFFNISKKSYNYVVPLILDKVKSKLFICLGVNFDPKQIVKNYFNKIEPNCILFGYYPALEYVKKQNLICIHGSKVSLFMGGFKKIENEEFLEVLLKNTIFNLSYVKNIDFWMKYLSCVYVLIFYLAASFLVKNKKIDVSNKLLDTIIDALTEVFACLDKMGIKSESSFDTKWISMPRFMVHIGAKGLISKFGFENISMEYFDENKDDILLLKNEIAIFLDKAGEKSTLYFKIVNDRNIENKK